ncbi:hypothetical protein [uncultured Acetobacteroides sp.]|uniref:hypothetical protein n=1 Tax=uncultured Acetobacteroides sp. TaxID=1760811 RepID=UPI0029F4ECBA|nr:hypothetical protein [uncultured Acetobacteroides sp.]
MLIYNFDSLTGREVQILRGYIKGLTKRYWFYAGSTALLIIVFSVLGLGIGGIVVGLPLNFIGWGILFTYKFVAILRDIKERVKVVGTAIIKEKISLRKKRNLVVEINGTKVFNTMSFRLLKADLWNHFNPGDKVYVEYARHSKLILCYNKPAS